MGFFSDVGNFISDNAGRAFKAVATGGISEFGSSNPFGVPPSVAQYAPIAAGVGLGAMFGQPMLGGQIGAGIFGNQQAAWAQRDANAQNIALAQQQMMYSAGQAEKQMAFQEQMSNTSVQRMQKDMMAAGINPMLAAGAGESTPSGAMGSGTAPRVDPIPSVGLGIASSARDLMSTYAGFKQSMAAADASRAQADLARVESGLRSKRGPEADIEFKFYNWLNKTVDRFSRFSAKSVINPPDVQFSPGVPTQSNNVPTSLNDDYNGYP